MGYPTTESKYEDVTRHKPGGVRPWPSAGNSEPDRKFNQWKQRYQSLIIKSGVPDSIIGAEDDWIYFLMHGESGDGSYDSRKDPRLLGDRSRALALRDLIVSYGGGVGECMHALPQFAFPWLYETPPSDVEEP